MKKLRRILPLCCVLLLLLCACASPGGGDEPAGSEYYQLSELTPAPEKPSSPSSEPTPEPSVVPEETEDPAEPTPEPTPSAAPAPTPEPAPEPSPAPTPEPSPALPEDGSYTSKEDVALYLHLYGRLPSNFITKNEARDLGWSGGSLEPYAPGKCIGGDYFGNYEGLLPEGKRYTECDIDTLGAKSRGAKRIIFSDDGCIYYTDDHYESFTQLYGEEP